MLNRRARKKLAIEEFRAAIDRDMTPIVQEPMEMNRQSIIDSFCQCAGTVPVKNVGEAEHAPLEGGGHTAFTLMHCLQCGKLRGFPHDNLVLFVNQGAADLVREFAEEFNKPPYAVSAPSPAPPAFPVTRTTKFTQTKAYCKCWVIFCAFAFIKATYNYGQHQYFIEFFNAIFNFMCMVLWILIHDAGGVREFAKQWVEKRVNGRK